MIGQYSKIATGYPNVTFLNNKAIVKTNANFEIKNAVLFLKAGDSNNKTVGVDLEDFRISGFVTLNGYSSITNVTIKLKIYVQNKNEIVLESLNEYNPTGVFVTKFIVTN